MDQFILVRWMSVLGTIIYPAWALVYLYIDPNFQDSFQSRSVMSVFGILSFLATFSQFRLQRLSPYIFHGLLLGVTAHFTYIMFNNQLHVLYMAGFFVCVCAISTCFTSVRSLLTYVSGVLICIVGQYVLRHMQFDSMFGFLALGTMTVAAVQASALATRDKMAEIIKQHEAATTYAAKLSLVGEMASGIAHEINNPVTIITGYCGRVARVLENPKPDLNECKNLIDRIDKMAWRISKIVKGLGAFAREGSSDPFMRTRIKTLVDDALDLSRQKAAKAEVQVFSNVPEILQIDCRSVQITQVLLNLIGNAIDAIENLPERWIKIELKDLSSEIELHVTDSGSGIPPEIASKILNPFFTTKEVGKGTGLGLSISKGIVDAHKGRFYLDTTCENTRFVIQLPKVQTEQKREKNAA